MSFATVLGSIFGVVNKVNTVVTAAEPAIALIPGYGPAFNAIFGVVSQVETLFAGIAGAGAAKKTVATTILQTVAPTLPAATVSSAIDQLVALLNGLQALQHSVASATPAAP